LRVTTTAAQLDRGEVKSKGAAYGLSVDDAISYGDDRGGRRINPKTGEDVRVERACAQAEGNAACDGLFIALTVRMPGLGLDDVVDPPDYSFPLVGHVHDCAVDEKTIAVVTHSQVSLLDAASGNAKVIDEEGADRIAIGPWWVAWSDGAIVRWRKR
jgi:hypothetical protein